VEGSDPFSGSRCGNGGAAPDRLTRAFRPTNGRPLANRAMELLRESVAKGYRNTDDCRTEDALNLVRGRPDFRLLIMDLENPDDPCARAE
jgi:hypothetical protein